MKNGPLRGRFFYRMRSIFCASVASLFSSIFIASAIASRFVARIWFSARLWLLSSMSSAARICVFSVSSNVGFCASAMMFPFSLVVCGLCHVLSMPVVVRVVKVFA